AAGAGAGADALAPVGVWVGGCGRLTSVGRVAADHPAFEVKRVSQSRHKYSLPDFSPRCCSILSIKSSEKLDFTMGWRTAAACTLLSLGQRRCAHCCRWRRGREQTALDHSAARPSVSMVCEIDLQSCVAGPTMLFCWCRRWT